MIDSMESAVTSHSKPERAMRELGVHGKRLEAKQEKRDKSDNVAFLLPTT